MQSALLFLLAEALLLQPLAALHIGKSSPCYSQCDGDDLTLTSHLSCLDAAYDEDSGTAAGKTMRECLTCTESSGYSNSSDTETDQYWFMFHLKYTQQYCLFDNAENQISDCSVECSPLEKVLTTLWGDTDPPRFLYDYCDASSGVYVNFAPDCASCLKNRTGTVILGNFMETMYSACDTKPNITTDSTAFFEIKGADGDLFDTQTEAATRQSAPTATDSSASVPSGADQSTRTGSAEDEGGASSADSASASSSPGSGTSSSNSDSDSGMSTAAAVGIGVGVTAAGIAAIVGVVFFILRRRRASRYHAAQSHESDKIGYMGMGVGMGSPATAGGSSAYGGAYGQMQQNNKSPYGGPGGDNHHHHHQQWGAGGYPSMDSKAAPVEMSAHGTVAASEMSAHGPAVNEMPAGQGPVAELPAEAGRR